VKYLLPFNVLKNSMKLLSVKGQLKVDMTYDEFLDFVKKFLQAVPIDEKWYRTTYPDVDEAIRAGAYHSARQHFVEHGYFEGRRPFELEIDEAFYMKHYPDIQESVAKGLVESARDHFVRHGYEEGRVPAEL
jgi:hypothetical protein